MVTTTRTLNPLPFQDLEPKRFEDMARQLLYDFRRWRRLEATGRSGSDDGFDARGWEIVDSEQIAIEDRDDDEAPETSGDRLWLIQCKREKSIGPSAMLAHLNKLVLSDEVKLYGIVLVAACDFSKKTRDTFLTWVREAGISEGHLWGKGELEDMLFQPKNDNLLFAYFGLSLTIRRRSLATELRSQIAIKRKLKKLIAEHRTVLLRDPSTPTYPQMPKEGRPLDWRAFWAEELTHEGLRVCAGWSLATMNPETGEWDAADKWYTMTPSEDWTPEDTAEVATQKALASKKWDEIPEGQKGWLHVFGFIPYSSIIAIDDIGDELFKGPHVYTPFGKNGPFADGPFIQLKNNNSWAQAVYPGPEKRVKFFPPDSRRPDDEVESSPSSRD